MTVKQHYRALISSHLNPVLSGVAKFNLVLSRKIGAPLCGFSDLVLAEVGSGPVLISIKIQDLAPLELVQAENVYQQLVRQGIAFDLFLHTYSDSPLEKMYVSGSRHIYCGNQEILTKIQQPQKTVSSWCPGLLDEKQIEVEGPLNLFCFGMAHKIQLWTHRALFSALEEMKVDYSLWLSTAFHEKANFGDFDSVSRSLIDIYGKRVRFLGFLSDDSVNYFLAKTNAFVAFFEKGVRANNTTVNAALERECPVITNLDVHSPEWLVHGKNVLDVSKITVEDFAESNLQRIGKQGAQDVAAFASWRSLIEQLRGTESC